MAKESLTVPAGTFDAYRIEGQGTNSFGAQLRFVYWVAPDIVRAPLVYESIFRDKSGRLYNSDRDELVSYAQLRAPGRPK